MKNPGPGPGVAGAVREARRNRRDGPDASRADQASTVLATAVKSSIWSKFM